MQFVHRLRTAWPWLPAFRAVAETEHLPTAAHQLDVVPSSLSRTVKLLEDELGVALFDRTGKTLVLNDAGRTILAAVRDAMRSLDEAFTRAAGNELRGNIGAVASSDLAYTLLAPACAELVSSQPDLCTSLVIASDAAVPGLLLRGDADVAVVLTPPDQPDLVVTELANWSRGVYGASERAATSRCVAVGTPSNHADDGWPAGCERGIATWAPDERAALEICARTELVTVAFDVITRSSGYAGRLVRLESPTISTKPLFLVYRRAVGVHRRTDALIEAIRVIAARLG